MVIGGMLGASFWRLAHDLLPSMPASPAPFVIVGMMALFGGIAHAPLAVMLMVAEMTGNLSMLAPAMVAVGVSTALVGDNTIYRSQLPNRASSPAHRVRFGFPLLSALLVRDAMVPVGPGLRSDAPLSLAEARLQESEAGEAVVVDERGDYVGLVSSLQIASVPAAARASTPIQAVVDGTVLTLGPDETLDVALEQLADRGRTWAPVVDQNQLIGCLHVRDVVTTYKATLERSVRRASALPAGTALLEWRVGATSPLAGRTLAEADLPYNTLVVSITRDGEIIFPRGATRLEAGDVALLMADPADEPALRAFLESSIGAGVAVPNSRR